MSAFITGFSLGLSLILAIGAQNVFVLRQGLKRQHVTAVVLFCATSDALLIAAGVGGLGLLLAPLMTALSDWLFAGAALWLASYGALRARDAMTGSAQALAAANDGASGTIGLKGAILACAVMTWGNPHVYLDTVLLLGSFSLPYLGMEKLWFAIGAMTASFVFFACLGYGAQLLAPVMHSAWAWRVLDSLTAVIMFLFSAVMLGQISWFNAA